MANSEIACGAPRTGRVEGPARRVHRPVSALEESQAERYCGAAGHAVGDPAGNSCAFGDDPPAVAGWDTPVVRVLISIDMEGVAGLATRGQVLPGKPDYPTGRRLMTGEANAAAAGAFDAGATQVLVNDSHGPMDNLLGEELDPRVDYNVGSPKPLSMTEGLSGEVDLLMCVGYHAGPQEQVGVLAHTYSGQAFADIRLNDEPLTELRLSALLAAAYGVPVGLVTGDNAICEYAQKLLPGVVAVAVKTAIGQTAARTMHPQRARDAIRSGAARAIDACRAGALKPLALPAEMIIDAEFRPHGAAEVAAKVPGAQRVGARGVRRPMANPGEMLDVIDVWGRLTSGYLS